MFKSADRILYKTITFFILTRDVYAKFYLLFFGHFIYLNVSCFLFFVFTCRASIFYSVWFL